MRTKSITIGLLLLLSCCMPHAVKAEEYSLSDLYTIALERSEKIKIVAEDVTFAELEKDRAVAYLLPRLTAYTNYQRYTRDKYNDLGVLIQPDTSEQWGVRADQSMSLSGREFVAISETRNEIRRRGYDLTAARENYLLEVARSYYIALMARKGLDIAQSNLERITKYRDAAASRFKVGEITKTVLLRAESELSGAKSDLVKAKNELDLANASLARLAGIDPGFTLREEPYREAGTAPLADLKNLAFTERPELKSLEYQIKIAGQEVYWAWGAYWPNLNLAAVYQKADQDPEPLTLNKESTYGAVLLSFPFFEGGLRLAEVREAKTRERQAKLLYEDEKKTVGLEVERAYLEITASKGTLTHLEDQAAFARDNYRGVSRQFALGLASSIDVIDANDLLVSSERQLARALYLYQLSILALDQATGTFMKEIEQKAKR